MIDYIKLLEYSLLAFLGVLLGMTITAAVIYLKTPRSGPLTRSDSTLIGREPQIRSLADRIRTGQSSAILGLFSKERTPLLGYLRSENLQQRQWLYGDKADKLIFSYVDVSLLDQNCTLVQLWEMILAPVLANVPDLKERYQDCHANQFKTTCLDNLMSAIDKGGWRLVLLLDWFEALLQRPQLGEQADFLRDLRSLAASRTPSPFVVITASAMSLMQFHQQTRNLNPSGSPFLNFLEGGITILGGLSEAAVDQRLQQQMPHLAKEVRALVKHLAGGHPYLLQVASSELLKVLQTGEQELVNRFAEAFYARIKEGNLLKIEKGNLLKNLQPRMCQALLAVIQQGKVLGFESELKELEGQGFIVKMGNQWQVRTHILEKFSEALKTCANSGNA